jgi:hypothetical protein
VEFVGCGWRGDGAGEFGWVDVGGAVQAFAGYVAGVQKAAGEVGDRDVREEDAFGAGAGDAHSSLETDEVTRFRLGENY